MTPSRGIRPKRRQSIFRHDGVHPTITTDPELVAKCVPLWKEAAKRANSRYGGDKPGNHKGRSAALYSVDDKLREHGITFDRDPVRWAAYEKAVRFAARKGRRTK